MKYCAKCGNELMNDGVVCPKCGCSADFEKINHQQIKQMVMLLQALFVLFLFRYQDGFLVESDWTKLIKWMKKERAFPQLQLLYPLQYS